MDLNLTWLIVIVIAAGFLAGKFIKRKALGLFSNLLVGIAGTLFGKWLFGQIGLSFGGGILGTFIMAFLGTVILLSSIDLIKKRL